MEIEKNMSAKAKSLTEQVRFELLKAGFILMPIKATPVSPKDLISPMANSLTEKVLTEFMKGDDSRPSDPNEFYVKAVWDDEAKVFYTDSNIKGLFIEADTIDEFGNLLKRFVPELIQHNHLNKTEATK